ncbi:MAG: hypothetical protein AAF788_05425 [Pseudomonadota bacterium]
MAGAQSFVHLNSIMFIRLLMIVAFMTGPAQAEEDAVLDVIDRFLIAYYEQDPRAMAATVSQGAVLGAVIYDQDGGPTIQTPMPAAEWVQGIAKGASRVAEAYWDPVVHIRSGTLAQVWTPYVVEADAALVHCGIDAFTLMKIGGAWMITDLHSTMEPGSCRELGYKDALGRLRPRALVPHLSSAKNAAD